MTHRCSAFAIVSTMPLLIAALSVFGLHAALPLEPLGRYAV